MRTMVNIKKRADMYSSENKTSVCLNKKNQGKLKNISDRNSAALTVRILLCELMTF